MAPHRQPRAWRHRDQSKHLPQRCDVPRPRPTWLRPSSCLTSLSLVGLTYTVQLVAIHHNAPQLTRLSLTRVEVPEITTGPLTLFTELTELELRHVTGVHSFRVVVGLHRLRSLTLLVDHGDFRLSAVASLAAVAPLECLITDGEWTATSHECELALGPHLATLLTLRCLHCASPFRVSWLLENASRLCELWVEPAPTPSIVATTASPLVALRLGLSFELDDLSPLASFTKLQSLQVVLSSACRDCRPLRQLQNLRELEIRHARVRHFVLALPRLDLLHVSDSDTTRTFGDDASSGQRDDATWCFDVCTVLSIRRLVQEGGVLLDGFLGWRCARSWSKWRSAATSSPTPLWRVSLACVM